MTLRLLILFLLLEKAAADQLRTSIEGIRDSVVTLSMRIDGEEQGNGTGFVIAPGVVATNDHVIKGVRGDFIARTRAQEEIEVLGLLATYPEHDIAFIKITNESIPPIKLASGVAVGDPVGLVGSPFGLEQTVGIGIVSAIRPEGLSERLKGEDKRAGQPPLKGPLVQHSISTSFGSSGSPIVNARGEVVAVHHSGITGSEINFGAHVSALREVFERTDLTAKPTPLGPSIWKNLLISAIVFGFIGLLFALPNIRRRLRRARRQRQRRPRRTR